MQALILLDFLFRDWLGSRAAKEPLQGWLDSPHTGLFSVYTERQFPPIDQGSISQSCCPSSRRLAGGVL